MTLTERQPPSLPRNAPTASVGPDPAAPPVQREGFLQLKVAGSPEEMGAQHGAALRAEIRDLLAALDHHIIRGQRGLVGLGLRVGLRSFARLMEPRIPSRYRREMQALAQAAGVSYRDILLLNCLDDILANLYQLGSLFGRLGCCVYALLPERSADGALLCGRNLDYFIPSAAGDDPWAATIYMKEHLVAIEHRPDHAHPFISVGWPGFIGAATAMNQRGLVVASLTVSTRRNWPFSTPATFLYRDIAERCAGLEDAIQVLRAGARSQGNNVLLASSADRSACIVEFTAWDLVVRRPTEGWVAATNHFLHPRMSRLNARAILFSSSERLARLGELCTSGTPDQERGRAFLLDRALRSPEAHEYCSVYNPCTIYSAFFAPDQRRLWVRATDQADRRYQEVAFSAP